MLALEAKQKAKISYCHMRLMKSYEFERCLDVVSDNCLRWAGPRVVGWMSGSCMLL